MSTPPHILIIDPDSSAANVTRTLIERVEPLATLAVEATAERGRLSIQQRMPSIVVIDPSPYNRSDEQLVLELKAQSPGVRVIVLTSASTHALRRRMQEIGADLYIEKPAAPTVLISGLRALIESSSA
jgi:DNA-binding NarL/FixJ family response regulator